MEIELHDLIKCKWSCQKFIPLKGFILFTWVQRTNHDELSVITKGFLQAISLEKAISITNYWTEQDNGNPSYWIEESLHNNI